MSNPKQHTSVIDEQKIAESDIDTKVEQRHLLVEAMQDYDILMVDTSGCVTSWNKGASFKGYTEEEIIGKSIAVFYTEEDVVKKVPAYHLKMATENGRFESESWLVRKDGTRFWANIAFTALYDSSGNVCGYLKVTRNLIERKGLQQGVKQAHPSYDGQMQKDQDGIVQRNRSLEVKIIELTRQLEEAYKELEAFTYSVSHDLKAPLRIIDGYSSILSDELMAGTTEENKRLLDIIMHNVQRMGKMIDELLNLSKLSRKALSIGQTNMTGLVKRVIEEHMEFNSNQANIRIADLHPASCDPVLMSQVWVNLISNAVKYSSKQEHPMIEISSVAKDAFVTYTVRDNGIGFDMKYADKLFNVFQRLHNITEYEGTGMGLTLVHRILVKHGGRVWAEAEEGKGATFYFSIPVAPDD